MATLQLTYGTVYTRISNFLGLTDAGTAPTGTDLTTCQDIACRGIRQFLYPIDVRTGRIHEWGFLKKYHTFNAIADKWKYSLPIDFSDVVGPIHYDTDELQPKLEKVSADQILEMRADVVTSEWPKYYAITPSVYDAELGTSYEMWLYPTPDQNYNLNFFYMFDPLKLSNSTDIIIGGVRACEAILESCLAVAETQEEDNTSTHHQAEAQRLIQALILDDEITNTSKIGNLYRDKDKEWPYDRPYLIPYNDDNIYS